MATNSNSMTTLERALLELVEDDNYEELRWASGKLDKEGHVKYLIRQWLGLSKDKAYARTLNQKT